MVILSFPYEVSRNTCTSEKKFFFRDLAKVQWLSFLPICYVIPLLYVTTSYGMY